MYQTQDNFKQEVNCLLEFWMRLDEEIIIHEKVM